LQAEEYYRGLGTGAYLRRSYRPKYWLHILLFLFTFFTTTIAGVAWLNMDPFDLANFHFGLPYSVLLLTVLTLHEFGHYFAARYHRVDATLPFYIPFPLLPGLIHFGTLGAIIRIRSALPNKKVLFDIGIAGPIAGFVASLAILVYGMTHLPGIEYLYEIHPEYRELIELPEGNLQFGQTLLMVILRELLVSPDAFFPPMNEIYHYPFLTVGWFGMLVTAINLLPVGQLDGGHIAYAMFGERHRFIARGTFFFLLLIGLLGFLPFLGISVPIGWSGWLFWAAIIYFVIKLKHPPVPDQTPLDPLRMRIGWTAYLMLMLCFSPAPISIQL
jgi:membrane-associated protease RseP (regulator of RpoE activity)